VYASDVYYEENDPGNITIVPWTQGR